MDDYGEPWGIDPDSVWRIRSERGDLVAEGGRKCYIARIVACVNACAGLTDQELTALGTGGVRKIWIEQTALRSLARKFRWHHKILLPLEGDHD